MAEDLAVQLSGQTIHGEYRITQPIEKLTARLKEVLLVFEVYKETLLKEFVHDLRMVIDREYRCKHVHVT